MVELQSNNASRGIMEAEGAGSSVDGQPILLTNGLYPISCLTCAKRKVKCDRVHPCANCQKHNITCEYRDAAPKGRKRKAPASTEGRDAQIEKYEGLLRGMGVDLASVNGSEQQESYPTPKSIDSHGLADRPASGRPATTAKREDDGNIPGRLVVQRGKTRYVEGNFWTSVSAENADAVLEDSGSEGDDDDDDETRDPNFPRLQEGYDGGGLLFGASPRYTSLASSYPSRAQFDKLWRHFKNNVHPLTMIVHAPSAYPKLAEACERPDTAHKETEALLFCILACTAESMLDEDCRKDCADTKANMLTGYLKLAERALSNANFLVSSSLVTLQAFAFYLMANRAYTDPRAWWNFTGMAVRTGQRLGLHRDLQIAGLTPFEVEMRRRIWYQVVLWDVMAAQLAGTMGSTPMQTYDVAGPTIVNDADLHPDMKEPPKPRQGATDMIFCQLRLKMFAFAQKLNADGKSMSVSMMDGNMGKYWEEKNAMEKEAAINGLQSDIETEVLRYCDYLNPIHILVTFVGRLIVAKLKFSARHPRQYQKSGTEMTKEVSDYLFEMALRVMEYDNAAHAQPELQRFLWHSHAHFQWSCLVHVLDELKTRTSGPQSDKGWEQMGLTYKHRPEILRRSKMRLPLYHAIHRMTLAAWTKREKAAMDAGEMLEVPDFIQRMRTKLTDDGQIKQSVSADSVLADPTPRAFEWTFTGLANSSSAYPDQRSAGYYDGAINPTGQYFFSPDNMGAVDWSMFDNMVVGDSMVNPAYGTGSMDFVENRVPDSGSGLWGTSENQGYR